MSDAACLFCRMAAGEIPVQPVVETEQVFAIRDIHPRAPVHVLIIPRTHLPDARALRAEHAGLLADLFSTATDVARREQVHERGYRLLFNVGADGGMAIAHLHLHLLGGRRLGPEG